MPTRILTVAVILIAAYAAALRLVPPGLERRGFGQKDNVVKVENIIYRAAPAEVLLVGSSMTGLLYPDMLPANWGNLAIGAGSSLTGLEIIERSGLKPRAVLVEVNMLMRDSDRDLLETVYGEPMHWLRTRVPALRLQNHPTTLLFSLIQRAKGFGVNVRNAEKYALGMTYHEAAFAAPLPASLVRARVAAAADLIKRLAGRGAAVYIVRYPMDPKIAALPQMVQLFDVVTARFAAPRYKWLSVPPDGGFITTDGVHLDTDGARRLARILEEGLRISGRLPAAEAALYRRGRMHAPS